jgi:hypothetical protein
VLLHRRDDVAYDITDLSLHREINVDLGHTVRISVWWESRMGAAE